MDEVIAVTDTSAANSADIASEYAKLVEKVRYAKQLKLAAGAMASQYDFDKLYYGAIGELTEYILLHPRFSDLLFASSADAAGTTAISSTDIANGGDAVSTADANGGDAVSTADANGAAAISTADANGGNAISSTAVVSGADAVSSTDDSSAVISQCGDINYSALVITVDCHLKYRKRDRDGIHYIEFIKCKCKISVIKDVYTLGMINYCAHLVKSETGDAICNIAWWSFHQRNCKLSNVITIISCFIISCLCDCNIDDIQLKFDTEYDYNRVVDFTPDCSLHIYEKLLRYKYDNAQLTKLRTSDAAHYSTSTIAHQQQCSTQCAQIEELKAQITALTLEKEAAQHSCKQEVAALTLEKEAAQHSCKQETAAYKLTQAAYNKASDNATYWKQQYYSVLDMYTTAQTDIATLYTQNTTNTSQITELSVERDKLTDANTQLKSQLADVERNYEEALYISDKYRSEYFDNNVKLAQITNAKATLFEELETTTCARRAADAQCTELTAANAVLQTRLEEQQCVMNIMDSVKIRLYQEIKQHQDTYTKLAKQYAENLVKSAANATAYSEYVILQEQRHALLQ